MSKDLTAITIEYEKRFDDWYENLKIVGERYNFPISEDKESYRYYFDDAYTLIETVMEEASNV